MVWDTACAKTDDIPELENLIVLSVRELQKKDYSAEQINRSFGKVFGVDRQLVDTYFVVRSGNVIVGCGGWSMRKSLFGGDSCRSSPDSLLDPSAERARIRAFFIHPDWSRRGIGSALLRKCEESAAIKGFCNFELVATLTGVPLYAANGYVVVERYEIPLTDGFTLPVVRMHKSNVVDGSAT